MNSHEKMVAGNNLGVLGVAVMIIALLCVAFTKSGYTSGWALGSFIISSCLILGGSVLGAMGQYEHENAIRK